VRRLDRTPRQGAEPRRRGPPRHRCSRRGHATGGRGSPARGRAAATTAGTGTAVDVLRARVVGRRGGATAWRTGRDGEVAAVPRPRAPAGRIGGVA
jgi:hypothetical protein